MSMKKSKEVPICSACEKVINNKKEFFLGRIGNKLPWYKPFHKKCYEEIKLSTKSRLRKKLLSKHLIIMSLTEWLSPEKLPNIWKVEFPIRRFWHKLAANKLNSAFHWVFSLFFMGIFLLILYYLLENHTFFYLIAALFCLQILFELIQLIYFRVKYTF